MSLLLDPGSQFVLKRRKAQEEMLRKLKARWSGAEAAAKLLKFRWAQRPATFITFITPGPSEATERTGSLQIAVGKGPPALRTERLKHLVSVNVTLIEQSKEHVMGNLGVIGGVRRGKYVKGYAQFAPAIDELPMIPGCYFLWSSRFLLSPNGNRRSVLVTARNHQHMIALKAMIAGKNIGWQIGTSDMPQVQWAIGIRPGNTYENPLAQIAPQKASLLQSISYSPSLS